MAQPSISKSDKNNPCNGNSNPNRSHWKKYNSFYWLLITTFLSALLIVSVQFRWRTTGIALQLTTQYPASTTFLVQLLAAAIGMIHVVAICRIINYGLRLRLREASVSLDIIRTWVNMTVPRLEWDLPLRLFFPVLLAVFLSLLPAALWAGSFAPIISATSVDMMITTPSYANTSMIREYPMDVGKAGPSFRSSKGLFTYSVGQQLIASLLSTAAGASLNESMYLVHPKIDNTRFSYTGRSYGMGSSVGLTDYLVRNSLDAISYNYTERGYMVNVTCIYNATSNFTLSPVSGSGNTAGGTLPDSVNGGEKLDYIGLDSKAIVAMGVAYSELSSRRFVAIAAGQHYAHLNNTQCELEFNPWLFAVTVDLKKLNILVEPKASTIDIDPKRNLTRTVARQFSLLSRDSTSLYDSMLGQALNASIAAYSITMGGSWPPLTQEQKTLGGLTNSVTAMADDMLVAYGAAQLMVGTRLTSDYSTASDTTVTVSVPALRFGQPAFIYAVFTLNMVVLLVFILEGLRTRFWHDLPCFDYLDPRDLIVAASRGGAQLAKAAGDLSRREREGLVKNESLLNALDGGNGNLVVRMGRDEDGLPTFELDRERNETLYEEMKISYRNLSDAEEEALVKKAWEMRKKWRVGMLGALNEANTK